MELDLKVVVVLTADLYCLEDFVVGLEKSKQVEDLEGLGSHVRAHMRLPFANSLRNQRAAISRLPSGGAMVFLGLW